MILYFLLKCEVYYDTKYEKKCETDYKEVCHGYGYHQKCYSEPVHHCHEVPKKVQFKKIYLKKNISLKKSIDFNGLEHQNLKLQAVYLPCLKKYILRFF